MTTHHKARKSKRASKLLASSHDKTDEQDASSKTFLLPTNKHLLELTSIEDFKSIIKDILDRFIVIEFFAHWCGPCKLLTSKLNEIAESYRGKLLIVKVDVDEFEDLAVEHKISAIPTFMIMKDKKVVEQFSNSNAELLEETLEKIIGKPEQVESSTTAGVEGKANE